MSKSSPYLELIEQELIENDQIIGHFQSTLSSNYWLTQIFLTNFFFLLFFPHKHFIIVISRKGIYTYKVNRSIYKKNGKIENKVFYPYDKLTSIELKINRFDKIDTTLIIKDNFDEKKKYKFLYNKKGQSWIDMNTETKEFLEKKINQLEGGNTTNLTKSDKSNFDTKINITKEIENLSTLKDKGILTQKEFDDKKSDLLKRL